MKEISSVYSLDSKTNFYPEITNFITQSVTGFEIRALRCDPDVLPVVIRANCTPPHKNLCMIKVSYPTKDPDLGCDTETLSKRFNLSFIPNTDPNEQDPVAKEKGGSICVGVALKKLGLINLDQLESYKQIISKFYQEKQAEVTDDPIFRHVIAVKNEGDFFRLLDQYGEVVVSSQVIIEIAKARLKIDPDAEIAVIFLPKDSV